MGFRLDPDAERSGYRLQAYPELDSTSSEALRRARDGERGPIWIVSGLQTAGRGRRGSTWMTPPGNLAASLLREVTTIPAPLVATLGFVGGLGLREALAQCCRRPVAPVAAMDGGGLRSSADGLFVLKWPNDVLAAGAKLAGILLETETLAKGERVVVVGIGANVTSAPEGLPYPVTSLQALSHSVTAESLFEALSRAWARYERMWDDGRGFAAVRLEWLRHAAGLDTPIVVRIGTEIIRGTFETVDQSGHLVVRTEAGSTRLIAAGEVHFGLAASAR
jgi:BirA family biotin operon repressor/biotin-[acetyl-CoA-carboxylase] ligase